MTIKIPTQPENSFRVKLVLEESQTRLDEVLAQALQAQSENEDLKNISKGQLKKLFTEKKVLIKGQVAKIKSAVNSGTTYVDILLS